MIIMLDLQRHEKCPIWRDVISNQTIPWTGLRYTCLKVLQAYCKVFDQPELYDLIVRYYHWPTATNRFTPFCMRLCQLFCILYSLDPLISTACTRFTFVLFYAFILIVLINSLTTKTDTQPNSKMDFIRSGVLVKVGLAVLDAILIICLQPNMLVAVLLSHVISNHTYE